MAVSEKTKDPQRQANMATGSLSHLIGAYYLLGAIVCDCDPQTNRHMRQLLLHLKGCFWAIMAMKYGIENPRKTKEG